MMYYDLRMTVELEKMNYLEHSRPLFYRNGRLLKSCNTNRHIVSNRLDKEQR